MLDFGLIKQRLSWYAASWVGSFIVVLVGALLVPAFTPFTVIEVIDVLAPIALAALGLATGLSLVLIMVRPHSFSTKLSAVILTTLLVLPLLWAPILGAVLAALAGGVSIEYSQAYAGFRIAVSGLLYPLVSLFVDNPILEFVWAGFEAIATIVGFLAAFVQVWPRAVKLLRPAETA